MEFLVAIFAIFASFIIGFVVGRGHTNGKMYFYKDRDGKEYAYAKFNADGISKIDSKSTITLECIKLNSDFSLPH